MNIVTFNPQPLFFQRPLSNLDACLIEVLHVHYLFNSLLRFMFQLQLNTRMNDQALELQITWFGRNLLDRFYNFCAFILSWTCIVETYSSRNRFIYMRVQDHVNRDMAEMLNV